MFSSGNSPKYGFNLSCSWRWLFVLRRCGLNTLKSASGWHIKLRVRVQRAAVYVCKNVYLVHMPAYMTVPVSVCVRASLLGLAWLPGSLSVRPGVPSPPALAVAPLSRLEVAEPPSHKEGT